MSKASLSSEYSNMSLIIWLDTEINKTEDNQQIHLQLRRTINNMKIFHDFNECEQYIIQAVNTRIYFIVNGQCDEQIISHIHSFPQILYIYIVSNDSEKDKQWITNFAKIRKLAEDLNSIATAIELDYQKQQKIQEPLSISIYGYEKSSTDINGSFLHSQLLIDFLQRIEPNIKDKDELVELCKNEYKNDLSASVKIDRFQKEYTSTQAIWWYTADTFLYRMLNKALRSFNIYQLFLFRFLIRDIRDRLIQLGNRSLSSTNTVYRGQLISRIELDTLQQSVNKIISMNSFLSTSIDRDVCLFMLGNGDDLYQSVLFEINIDPKRIALAKPFANILAEGAMHDEEEVLFMLGSIFRISDVFQQDDGIWIIRMSLCNDDDHDLKPLFQHLKCNIENPANSLLQFGLHLREAAYYQEAERFCQRVLKEFEDKNDDASSIILAYCYCELGSLSDEKEKLKDSLRWYEKALAIQERVLPSNDRNLAATYISLGLVYHKKNDFKLALEKNTKALHILQRVPGDTNEFVAGCLFNIGRIHAASASNHPSPVQEQELERALKYYNEALDTRKIYLSEYHPDLAATYENIALVYQRFGEFDQAFQYLDKTLQIKQKSLSPDHPFLGFTHNNLGSVHYSVGNYQQALLCFKEALKIHRTRLEENHPEIVKVKENIEHALKALNKKDDQ